MKTKITPADTAQREHEAAESETMQPELPNVPGLDEIRQRAYELHLEGGSVHGRDLDDWLQAERELKGR